MTRPVSAELVWSSMTSVSGQAAEVRVMSRVRDVVVVDVDAVDETEVDHVDAELGVDHVVHGLLDVVDLAMPPAVPRRLRSRSRSCGLLIV